VPQIPQKLFFDAGVRAQRQSEPTLWLRQASSLLNQTPAKCGEPIKGPERRSLFCRLALRRPRLHLKLSIQGVCEDHRQQEGLISQELLDGNVIHLPFRFQLSKDRLLGSSAFMVRHHVPSGDAFVRDYHLELVFRRFRNEKIQLPRSLALNSAPRADDEKAGPPLPTLRFPTQLEVRRLGVDTAPMFAGLDLLLQAVEPLEGYRDSELHADISELTDDCVAKKGTVHANLDHSSRKYAAHSVYALEDELPRTAGVVNVAGSVEDIKDLPSLCDGTEQRVVTALPFLLTVEANCRSLRMSAGAQYRTIEVESNPPKLEGLEAIEDEVTSELLKPLDGLGADRAESSTECRNIGKPLETKQTQDHGIVAVVGDLAQLSVSKQNVEDQGQELKADIISGVGLDVPKAGAESISELERVEEDLEEQKAGEGTESLVGKSEVGESSGFTSDLFSAKLHRGGLSWLVCAFGYRRLYQKSVAIFTFLWVKIACRLTSPAVELSDTAIVQVSPLLAVTYTE